MAFQPRHLLIVAALTFGLSVAACGGNGGVGASVPTVGGASSSGAANSSRAEALHAAAECVRQHGIPNFQDPALSPDGSVYTDTRAIQDATKDTGQRNDNLIDAVRAACQSLVAAADWNPDTQPPAPPAMVQAGVRAAECMRAHGLPNVKDPTPSTPYTPGHGFGLTADQMPAGGKADPTAQSAMSACRSLLDAEIDASSLTNLAKG